jgi:hypothetical protein
MLNRAAEIAEEMGTVKLVDQFPMFELGVALGLLRDTCNRENEQGIDQWYACWQAKKQIHAALEGDQPLNFCRRAALDLVAALDRQLAAFRRREGDNAPVAMPTGQFYAIRKKLDIFEHQLSGDLNKTASYVIPELGIFNVELLAENADRHIHETIREHISDFAIAEFKEAGRCLAFGLHSACGFHAVRSVEDVLRTYYEKFIGEPPEAPMGLLASNLADLLNTTDGRLKPRENTIRHIKDITNFDRNPLIHRRVVLKEVEAIALFNTAIIVIGEMVKDLVDCGYGQQTSLPLQAGSEKVPRRLSKKAEQKAIASSQILESSDEDEIPF